MDYEREDRIATRRGYASLESARRVQAGDYPYTILEACHVLGLDNPYTHDDLVTVARVCRTWNIATNVDEMLTRLLDEEDRLHCERH